MLIYMVFYVNNCHMEHFGPIFVPGQNGSKGVVE